MTQALPISDRDQAALSLAYSSGRAMVSTPEWTSDLEPQEAVFTTVARHLANISAGVADLSGTDAAPKASTKIAFRNVLPRWPDAWSPALYPLAALSEKFTTPWDAIGGYPVRRTNEHGVAEDIVTDEWALWELGEDVGEAVISIFASHNSHATALERAVVESLFADLDQHMAAVLPLPELYLPPPFVGVLPVEEFPKVRVSLAKGGSGETSERKDNAWRVDVAFRWQAKRLTARPRVPDLTIVTKVLVSATLPEI